MVWTKEVTSSFTAFPRFLRVFEIKSSPSSWSLKTYLSAPNRLLNSLSITVQSRGFSWSNENEDGPSSRLERLESSTSEMSNVSSLSEWGDPLPSNTTGGGDGGRMMETGSGSLCFSCSRKQRVTISLLVQRFPQDRKIQSIDWPGATCFWKCWR